MLYGISGREVRNDMKYAGNINPACAEFNFPPMVAYAIAWRESISMEGKLWPDARKVDLNGGHGLFQLDSSFPDNWEDADVNTNYALKHFLVPALTHWHGLERASGNGLIRLVAATFNAGLSAATLAHLQGDVDLSTAHHDYASTVLRTYLYLTVGGKLI